jgi:hypothetical protein
MGRCSQVTSTPRQPSGDLRCILPHTKGGFRAAQKKIAGFRNMSACTQTANCVLYIDENKPLTTTYGVIGSKRQQPRVAHLPPPHASDCAGCSHCLPHNGVGPLYRLWLDPLRGSCLAQSRPPPPRPDRKFVCLHPRFAYPLTAKTTLPTCPNLAGQNIYYYDETQYLGSCLWAT